jgi:hypothetical protein
MHPQYSTLERPETAPEPTAADLAACRYDPIYTLSAACPLCHGVLILCQTREGRRFSITCTRRPCAYTAAYDPVLSQLRDRIARLEAELAFTHLQTKPVRAAFPTSPATTAEAHSQMHTLGQGEV